MTDTAPVTQADREEAAEIYRHHREDEKVRRILGGNADSDPLVQTFARRRQQNAALGASIAAIEAAADHLKEVVTLRAENERLRAALKEKERQA